MGTKESEEKYYREFVKGKSSEEILAHNSFVSEQERKLMKSYFEIILKQIDQNTQ